MTLDSDIMSVLENNTIEYLEGYEPFFIGDRAIQDASKRIVIGEVDDQNQTSSFDSDTRKIIYNISAEIRETLDYVEAKQELKKVAKAISRLLKQSQTLNDYNVSIDRITPIYDNDYILKIINMEISFTENEDYGTEESTFDTVDERGDFFD